jgi:hypothetical protein
MDSMHIIIPENTINGFITINSANDFICSLSLLMQNKKNIYPSHQAHH